MKTWQATVPTNIALIKYMGKTDAQRNVPSNGSLSYTLPHLTSTVTLQLHEGARDIWQPLEKVAQHYELSNSGQQKFLNHLAFLKQQFGFQGNFIVCSANNFPSDCGLASSASSFAALTQCTVNALQTLGVAPPLKITQIAALSRQGSGSSCRSFFAPWAMWQGENVTTIALPYTQLQHRVVIVSKQIKMVSSREAHSRVQSSPLFHQRAQRAEQRLTQLISAFQQRDWPHAYTIVWQEFSDMHALFETATQPFGYCLPESLAVLAYLCNFWENHGDGPLVTMDAGPNVHLLFRPEQQTAMSHITAELGRLFTIL
ncbi:MAG: diphosphomevalonate decarboxylase [Gammaproteobacteria bacterium]